MSTGFTHEIGALIARRRFGRLAVIDTATGDHILRIVSTVRLLDAIGVLVGIQAEIAQMFVGLGVDLGRVRVHQNLREALKACMSDVPTA